MEGICPIGGAEHDGFAVGFSVELRCQLWVQKSHWRGCRWHIPEIILMVVHMHMRAGRAEGVDEMGEVEEVGEGYEMLSV